MIFLDVPNLDPSNYPYSVVYDCGDIDYLLCSCRSKGAAKINRKKLQHLFDKKLLIVKTGRIRSRGVMTEQEEIITDVRRPEHVLYCPGGTR
jgi:hypothetical protein